MRSAIYVTYGDETALITSSKGYVRFKTEDIPTIIEELKGIYEDDLDRKRMEVELKRR